MAMSCREVEAQVRNAIEEHSDNVDGDVFVSDEPADFDDQGHLLQPHNGQLPEESEDEALAN